MKKNVRQNTGRVDEADRRTKPDLTKGMALLARTRREVRRAIRGVKDDGRDAWIRISANVSHRFHGIRKSIRRRS